ncbi:MAG: M15 family metallopeptidase, partial [Actinomycetota bacterium]|nr:M15 family metallopeptidase [Actinomycetota bacterium]
NHPSDFGWSAYGGSAASNIAPFTYRAIPFPSGIADILQAQATYLLDRLVPMINGGLHDVHDPNQNGEWGFENRANVNSPGLRSFHSYGLALDLNAPWNGNKTGSGGTGQFQVPPSAAALCRSIGWLHGGEWGDPMHVECHNTPAEVAAWNHTNGGVNAAFVDDASDGFPLPVGYYYGPLSGPTESISGLAHENSAWIAGLRDAQTQLNVRSPLHVVVDGAYQPPTAAAARAFQAQGGLEADGLIGIKTWTALFAQAVAPAVSLHQV